MTESDMHSDSYTLKVSNSHSNSNNSHNDIDNHNDHLL